MERIVLKITFQIIDFQIIFNKWFDWGGTVFFCKIFFLKRQNTLEYAQILLVMCPKLYSVTALLSLPPTWVCVLYI